MVILLLLICWPIAELFVAIQIAGAIGVLPTVLLLIAGWPVGIWALRSQGRAAWRRLGAALSTGRSAGREVLDGALILLGGVLLIVPGLITDVLALCMLISPIRGWTRRLLADSVQDRLFAQTARFGRSGRRYDVDSTATDVEQPQLGP